MHEWSLKLVELLCGLITIASYNSDLLAEKLTNYKILATVLVQILHAVFLSYGFF